MLNLKMAPNWEALVEGSDDDVLDLALDGYHEDGDDYPEDVAIWAHALRVTAYSTAEVDAAGQNAGYLLTPALMHEMPEPLARALTGVRLGVPEDPWPNWARIQHPINWPALITANPAALVWCDGMLEANTGATSAAITDAYQLLDTHGLRPYLEVLLWVEPDGRTGVEPTYLATDSDIAPELNRRVDDILVAGGRPRDRLHDADDLAFWLVEA